MSVFKHNLYTSGQRDTIVFATRWRGRNWNDKAGKFDITIPVVEAVELLLKGTDMRLFGYWEIIKNRAINICQDYNYKKGESIERLTSTFIDMHAADFYMLYTLGHYDVIADWAEGKFTSLFC